jgi:hypothetical protein
MSDLFEEVDIDVEVINRPSTPPKLRDAADSARGATLPAKSKQRYNQAYDKFVEWQLENNAQNLFSENILLAYFREMSLKYCPTTLWSVYSMLRSLIYQKHKVHIKDYRELLTFLKSLGKGYKPTKAKVFSDEEVAKFIQNAEDHTWLAHKVCNNESNVIAYSS